MKVLRKIDIEAVSGAEIIPGSPSNDIKYINVKLMIFAGRGQMGFDVDAAASALQIAGPGDFWNRDVALQYVRYGDIPLIP
jgi:hypothetical protein